MSEHSIRRVVGGVSAFAIAAGFAVVTGSGVAQAASGTVDWWDGNSHFTRTVSNTTPAEGDVVTVSTKFERKAWTTLEILYGVKDVHAPCLTYVEGSAKVDGSPRGLDSQGADFAKVAGSWTVYPNIDPKSHTFEFSYKVGPDCARDTALQSGMHYSGSLGSGTYDNKGPAITVGKNASTTTLAGVTSAETGTAVTLSATVTGGANGDAVEFFDGSTKIGSGTLNNGVATASWTPTAGGAHALTAKYLGSARANGSTSAVQNVTVSVPNVATTTTVSGPATVVEGEAVTLTAQVAPTPAGGTVQFKDGATDLGAPATVGADGKATLSLPSLAAGAHQVTAVYSGVAGFAGSTSAPFTVTSSVPDVATTTTLTAPATADEGQEVTLTAAVSPAPAGGTVQFKAGGVDLGAPVAVTNGSASINRTLAVGAHELTAVYSGAPGFVASVSEARTLTVSTVVVPDVQTTTTLTAPATADEGQEVTLTAAVSPAPAGGTVQFKAGGVDLGAPVAVTNGSASINRTLAVGAHELTAVYSGAPGFVASVSEART
ncbi:Ig-like domain-containing protein, partial [Rhodococcus sp. Q]|uniref:Ig-like domain-containing protein n=1 Tax=Rhodococcus sp. Q TaxID=2502252 RepID=UPI0010F5C0FD